MDSIISELWLLISSMLTEFQLIRAERDISTDKCSLPFLSRFYTQYFQEFGAVKAS